MTAQSYDRVPGANDRVRLAQLGCGDRSGGHVHMMQLAALRTPVETVAVCDLWSLARERRAAQVVKVFGTRIAKKFSIIAHQAHRESREPATGFSTDWGS